MRIRELNLDDAAEIHSFYTVFRDAELAENADRPVWHEEVMAAHFLSPAEDEDALAFAAFDDDTDGRLVGAAFVFYPLLDNTTKTYTGVFVAPQERGRGIGSALVEHVAERVRADGRTVILGEATYGFDRRDDHPYRRFAERRGFAVASTEVVRRLDLPVPEARIQEWLDEAAPFHRDYRIAAFVDGTPDELLPSVCSVVNQLALDAPTGDIDMEAEQITPEIRRAHDERNKLAGLTRYETVAIDATGSAVAVTTLVLHRSDPQKAHQWATIVQREHRGHRLGLAVKAHNLRAVQRDHPECTLVSTCNEEHNDPMVGINERMGFVPVELLVELQRKLDR